MKKKSDDGVSEILGTILLLGMTVSFFSLIYGSVLLMSPASPAPSANIVFTVENDNIIINHLGGTALPLATEILMTIGTRSMNASANDGLDDKYRDDNLWGIGEKLVFTVENLSGELITINVIDADSGSIIMTGKL